MTGVAATGAVRPAMAAKVDVTNPQDKLDAYVRLRGRTDGKPAYMWYRATIFAKVEGEPGVPIFNVEGCAWSRATRLEDGRWKLDNVEAGYYLDRATGQPLDTWVNPINGLTCRIQHYRSFQHVIATADNVERAEANNVPGLSFVGTVPQATVLGDQIWMSEDLQVKAPNKPKESFADPLEYTGPFITSTSLATWCGRLSDLANPKLGFVPATLSYQTINSWRPWLRMGTTPGVFTWRMQGVKLPRREDIGAEFRARVVKDYPDFFERL
jgi:hypothetical protein